MKHIQTSLIALFFGGVLFSTNAVAEPTAPAAAENPTAVEDAAPSDAKPADDATHADDHGDAHQADAPKTDDPAGHGDAHKADDHGDAHKADTHGDAHKADAHGDGHGDAHGDGHGDAHGGAHGDAHGDGHHGESHGMPWIEAASGSTIVQHIWNLVILLAVLFFFARRGIADALRGRALGIKTELVDAARERDEARQRHAEVQARLSRFESELETMREEAAEAAKADEESLKKRANEAAARIRETAERNIRDEVTRAQVALRKEAVDLAVKLAEDTLRTTIKSDDQRRLARQFLESLED